MLKAQKHQGDQISTDLKPQGVFANAEDIIDLQVMFDLYDEDLDLPALPVSIGNHGGAQVLVVNQQHNLSFVFEIPHHDLVLGTCAG